MPVEIKMGVRIETEAEGAATLDHEYLLISVATLLYVFLCLYVRICICIISIIYIPILWSTALVIGISVGAYKYVRYTLHLQSTRTSISS